MSTINLHLSQVSLFGYGPIVAYILGYSCTAIPLEIILYFFPEIVSRYGIKYSRTLNRKDALANTQTKVTFRDQLWAVFVSLFGPTAIVNGIIAYYLLSYVCPHSSITIPDIVTVLKEVIVMELIGDFFLYWGHRIQHEIPFLWKHFHHFHHSLDTPSPVSTLYISSVDATLQGALPIIFAIAIVKPHILNMYIYIFLRVAENVLNHSGLDWPILNLITLKILPGRASIAHHDSHHRFCNYAANAKNYGEVFWIWDYCFGTYRSTKGLTF